MFLGQANEQCDLDSRMRRTEKRQWKKLTALVDYVIGGDNVMTLFIVAGHLLLWCLFKA
jgi:hypothetical protein